mgnify:FL=1
MAKLKTLILLVLAGFILVGCGSDPRADDKAVLTEKLLEVQGDAENAADVAECVVGVMDENLDDDAWTAFMFVANEDEAGAEKWLEENEVDEEALEAAIESAMAKAEADCEVDL